jgi:hypothetical protein
MTCVSAEEAAVSAPAEAVEATTVKAAEEAAPAGIRRKNVLNVKSSIFLHGTILFCI